MKTIPLSDLEMLKRVASASLVLIWSLLGLAAPVWAESLEPVKGHYCYTFGDTETPSEAKQKALGLARQRAVESHAVYITNQTKIENFQLKEDVIESVSVGLLRNVNIEKEEEQGRRICIFISAQIEPDRLQEEIDRRLGQREVKHELNDLLHTSSDDGSLKIWVNKPEGSYTEGEGLVVYVKSNRDAYLKLDYFQANGTVVHLVPNIFREQAFIQKGKTYEFGGPNSPERFVISGPFGDEVIKGFASIRPFAKSLQPSAHISQSKTYLGTLKQGLDSSIGQKKRGVMIVSGATAPLHTRSREVSQHRESVK